MPQSLLRWKVYIILQLLFFTATGFVRLPWTKHTSLRRSATLIGFTMSGNANLRLQSSIDSHDSIDTTNTAEENKSKKHIAYEEALEALLNSPLHQARTKEALEKTAARRTHTISDMKTYLQRISLDTTTATTNASSSMNVVHITGTKGKGSTSCLCESILRRHYGQRTGLFTSPHLVDIRERIRINGQPIAKDVFGEVYWEVRKRLEAHSNNTDSEHNDGDNDDDLPTLPGYFRMLTLMAMFTFTHYLPRLDVIVLEVGMGGRYDATNILDITGGRNVVCGVTLLDLDHTRVLGDTLEQIAWEKGGIFQAIKGAPAYTPKVSSNAISSAIAAVSETLTEKDSATTSKEKRLFVLDSNTKGVISVLKQCAKEESNGSSITLVGEGSRAVPDHVKIGLAGSHQRLNAELAVALSDAVMAGSSVLAGKQRKRKHTDSLYEALESASWPGRCQTVQLEGATWPTNLRLDGSHTPISLKAGFDWFCSVSSGHATATTVKRVLIFNCSHERNPVELLRLLLESSLAGDETVPPFEQVYFCRADFSRPSAVTKANAEDLLQDQGIETRPELLPASDKDSSSGGIVTWQMTLETIWKHLEVECKNSSKAATMVNLTVGNALNLIKSDPSGHNSPDDNKKVEVFLAGSLYIVGSALSAIGWMEREAGGIVTLNSK